MAVQVVPVPVDEQGLDVSKGRSLGPHARLAYVTPAHQYPLGYEMSLQRRRELLGWALEADAYVVEDDYDGDYRYEGRPIACLQGIDGSGRVIYVGSFNKILFPALRIAFAIVPESLVGAFVDAKHVADGHTAMLTQGVLAAFIQDGHLARHLRKTRAIYDERRQAFLVGVEPRMHAPHRSAQSDERIEDMQAGARESTAGRFFLERAPAAGDLVRVLVAVVALDVQQPAEPPFGEHGLQRAHGRPEAPVMPDCQHHAGALAGPDHRARVGCAQRERLLAEDVLAGLRRGDGLAAVQ